MFAVLMITVAHTRVAVPCSGAVSDHTTYVPGPSPNKPDFRGKRARAQFRSPSVSIPLYNSFLDVGMCVCIYTDTILTGTRV